MTHAVDLLVQTTLMAAVALGAWVAMGDGMILRWFAKLVEHLPPFVAKPLTSCPRCMCSVWGLATLVATGFGVGVSINFGPDVYTFNQAAELVAVHRPLIAIEWARVAQVLAMIFAAIGVQELLHRS